jgi:replicative DNA helicase
MHEPGPPPAPRSGGRVPPQDLEAERAVLGAIMISNDAADLAQGIVKPDDFYRPAHRKIYQAMLELWDDGSAVDLVTLQSRLATMGAIELVGGPVALVELAEAVPTAANVKHYAELVRGRSVLRQLISAGTEIVDKAFSNREPEDVLDEAEQSVLDIRKESAKRGVVHIEEALKNAFAEIERLHAEKRSITGVATGYEKLDYLTSGLQRSDLLIIAGRPAMGKTAFALNVATHAALRGGEAVVVFSLEMSKEQLVKRMLCSEGRIDASNMRRGDLKDADWPKLAKAAGSLSEAKIFIDDSGGLGLLDTRAKCRRLHAEHTLGLVVIDYLQLMKGGARAQSREQEISEISRGLKELAKELNVPIIALSQLNRSLESRPDKRPVLSDLRESGAIEQDADIIMFVYRDEYYNPETEDKGVAEVIIAKQRSGPTGKVRLKFFNQFTRFENLAE